MVELETAAAFAGCQVLPSSVETSTPATTAGAVALAWPVTVIAVPSATVVPGVGEVTVATGAVVVATAPGVVSPLSSVDGWAPMSPSRLTVACCMFRSVRPLGLWSSRPHAHWTVPAPKTSAPLAARYSERWCVAVWLVATLVP